MLGFIWAQDQAGHIGYQGKLPWHLPSDLAYFKQVTASHPMIMGKKTFASFPGLLPNRLHVILTHDVTLADKYANNKQVCVLNSKAKLDEWLAEHAAELCYIIGGASLFEQYKDQVDLLYVTQIAATFEGDTKMPTLNYDEFELIEQKSGKIDEKNHYPHEWLVYRRK